VPARGASSGTSRGTEQKQQACARSAPSRGDSATLVRLLRHLTASATRRGARASPAHGASAGGVQKRQFHVVAAQIEFDSKF
jgi:hypothetical protein